MRYGFKRLALIGSAAALAVCAAAALAQEGNMGGEIGIYKGDPVKQAGMSLSTWGSGEATESGDHVFIGSRAIKVVTHGPYQGARLVLQSPVDVKPALDDKNAYLQLAVVLPGKQNESREFGGYGYPGAPPGMMGRRGGRGGYPGGPGGSGAGGAGGQDTGMTKPKPLSQVRVVLVTSDNKRTEIYMPISSASTSRQDFSMLAVPVAALTALKNTTGQIKEVRVFGDNPAVIYVGEIRVIRDETPIRVDDLPDYTVAVNDPVTFTASAEAGATPLKYEWDFDTEGSFAPDAEGRTVVHRYRKSREGDYTVTLKVSDLYGLKQPVTRTTKVHVTL